MSIHIHTDFYQDELEKRSCADCLKSFIVGAELGATVQHIVCPYCGSKNNSEDAWVVDGETLGALGCAGIYFNKSNEGYFNRCVFCREKLTPETLRHSGVCVKCISKEEPTND